MFRRSELGLLLLAPLVCVVHFVERGALWGDESALAMNIVPKTIGELGNPFVYTQIAPWGYLFLTKLITLVLGDGEHALRTFSLISGIAVAPLVFATLRRLDRRAAITAALLTAISPQLLYFCAELKPYATDAAVTAVALALVAHGEDRRARIGLAIFGAIAVWLSLSAIFVLGGAFAALLWMELRGQRRLPALALIAASGLVACAAFFLHLQLFVGQSSAATSHQVTDFWAQGFMPFPPRSLADLRWLPAKFFYAFVDPGGFGLRYLAGLLFAAGVVAIGRKHAPLAIALVVPLVLLLVASALGRDPVLERLLVFTVPIMIAGIAGSLLLIERWWIAAVPVALIASFSLPKLADRVKPLEGPDIADFAERLERELRPEDGLFLDDSVQWTWLYYEWKHPLPVKHVDTSKIPPDSFFEIGKPQAYLQQLEPVFGKKRVYVILSDFAKPGRGATFDRYYTWWLESKGGKRLEEVRGQGLLFAIYDLSEAKP